MTSGLKYGFVEGHAFTANIALPLVDPYCIVSLILHKWPDSLYGIFQCLHYNICVFLCLDFLKNVLNYWLHTKTLGNDMNDRILF